MKYTVNSRKIPVYRIKHRCRNVQTLETITENNRLIYLKILPDHLFDTYDLRYKFDEFNYGESFSQLKSFGVISFIIFLLIKYNLVIRDDIRTKSIDNAKVGPINRMTKFP